MRTFGLIGYPLGHSFSQAYFTEKFRREGIADCQYELFPMESLTGLRDWLSIKPEVFGLNVTIPHKQAVIEQLDWIDPAAAAIGAVNTIRIKHMVGEMWLEGFNTDVVGFEASLKNFLGNHKPEALVFGTGGSAKAVCWVLDKLNIAYHQVSRRPQGGQLAYAGITPEIATSFRLWINTTPLGMAPAIEGCPRLPYDWLSSQHYCFDLIYNPAETLFLQKAKMAGAKIQNGLEMLHLQADAAWRIWQEADPSNVFLEMESGE